MTFRLFLISLRSAIASDPAWKATGLVRTFDGHDPLKASERSAREQRQAAQRRAKSARAIALSKKAPGKKADVYVLPRKHA
jgi:hypothetical protein